MKALPPSLLRLLYSPDIEKRGVNLSGDLKKLARDFKLDMSKCMSTVDLEKLMAQEHPELPKRRWGLAALSSVFLDHVMEKKTSIRMSNWENDPLSDSQKSYATDDAYASWLLGDHIRRVSADSGAVMSMIGGGGGSDLMDVDKKGEDGDVEDAVMKEKEELNEEAQGQAMVAGGVENGAAVAGQGPGPVVEKGDGRRTAMTHKQRLEAAMKADQEGFDYGLGIVDSPPVHDEAFLKTLADERRKGFLCTRTKLDPFHWMQRYGRAMKKSHLLFGIFFGCLRDALFVLNEDDVKARRAMMAAKGIVADDAAAARTPKSYFSKRNRARRLIVGRLELAVRVQLVFETFTGLCDEPGGPLITDRVKDVHRKCMKHVWRGCLSDIPGLQMYRQRNVGKDGLPEYVTIRGTSQLEGYHRWLRACISGSQLSPRLFKDLLAHFNYRWNIRSGIKNLGQEDWATYSHWEIESVLRIVKGRQIEGGLFPGFEPAMSMEKIIELGVDINQVGYHMPPEYSAGKGSSAGSDDEGVPDGDGGDDDDEGLSDLLHGHDGEVHDCHGDGQGGSDVQAQVEVTERDELSTEDLQSLRSMIAGSSDQARILASGSVQSVDEIKLTMKLIGGYCVKTRRKRGGKKGKRKLQHNIDYHGVAAAFNIELKRRSNADASYLSSSGMKLKSPADIADFVRRADGGLQVEACMAGARQEFIEMHRFLKSSPAQFPEAAAVVSAATNHLPHATSESEESGSSESESSESESESSSRSSDSDSSSSEEEEEEEKQGKKKKMTCQSCKVGEKKRVTGAGIGGTRWYCTNTECVLPSTA